MRGLRLSLLEKISAGDGVTIRGSGWYMLHVDFYGLCLYKYVGVYDIDLNHDGRLRVIGIDVI